MVDLSLLLDLHLRQPRQGPGGDAQTRLAVRLSGLAEADNLAIADIGCGTGASTLVLAQELDARITAVDFLPGFLEELQRRANEAGLESRIHVLAASMDELPFEDGSLDAIWAEGAIYNIGFENGIRTWRRFLKPGGVLAVSELTWLTDERPVELDAHWQREYPQVATASHKLALLERHGYTPLGYFPLPEDCWLENYYRPLQRQFPAFLRRHGNSLAAREIVEAEKTEIGLYERYSAFVSYGYYIARRRPD